MDKNQEDTLNMYQAVHDVLTVPANAAIYAGNVPFQAAVDELETDIETIGNLRDQQEEDTSGVTEDKQNKRNLLEASTYQIGSLIVFYASATNNRKLLQKVNFTRNALTKARDNELPGMSEQVHQAATDNAAAILPYGVTGTMTTNLGLALEAFVGDISKPRAAKSETSSATKQLPDAFAKTDILLTERIDRGMELYISHTDFYNQYTSARIIVNSPTLTRALQIKFTDSVTGLPIAHVFVQVDESINRRSSNLGNIYVQNLAEGDHTFSAKLPGYTNTSQPFIVIGGETTKINVSMVKV